MSCPFAFSLFSRSRAKRERVDSVEALIRGPRGTNFERADILFDYVRRKKAEAAVDQSCLAAICDAAKGLPSKVRINVNVHASTLGHNSGFIDFFRRQIRKTVSATGTIHAWNSWNMLLPATSPN